MAPRLSTEAYDDYIYYSIYLYCSFFIILCSLYYHCVCGVESESKIIKNEARLFSHMKVRVASSLADSACHVQFHLTAFIYTHRNIIINVYYSHSRSRTNTCATEWTLVQINVRFYFDPVSSSVDIFIARKIGNVLLDFQHNPLVYSLHFPSWLT